MSASAADPASASEPLLPFNRASIAGREFEYAQQAMTHLCGDGPFTRRCERLLEGITGARRALLTPSCTAALEMSALLLDIQPGDEIIVPSFTFVSTVNAFVLRGGRPVFCDIRPDTLNLDETKLRGLLTERTRAVVPVHYAGVACEMDPILDLCQRHGDRGIAIIEDNAHGLFGTYRGRPLGSFGVMATQSFHETKNITCGEGGALLLNDPQHIERAEIIREKGTNRSRFFRGQVDKYTWVDLGSSYLMSDLTAGFLLAQLEAADAIQRERQRVFRTYLTGLAPWAAEHGVQLPVIPPHCEAPAHLFFLLLPTLADRQALHAHLRAQGVHTTFHYVPLHLSEMGRRYGYFPGNCPVTESVTDRLLRLPVYGSLRDEDLQRVLRAVRSFRPAR